LDMEAVITPDKPVHFYKTTRCHVQNDGTLQALHFSAKASKTIYSSHIKLTVINEVVHDLGSVIGI
jgi:uncharacterized protein YvpB